jgi:hypothetical protein
MRVLKLFFTAEALGAGDPGHGKQQTMITGFLQRLMQKAAVLTATASMLLVYGRASKKITY